MKLTFQKRIAGQPAVKLAYSYRRYSSVNQTDNTSLSRQLEMAQAVCLEKGWALVDLPPDAGVSAYKGLNKIKGALGNFLTKVKAGEIRKGSVLVIEKMDRFSRDEVDIVAQDFLSLLQSGMEIFSCVDRTHYTLADIRKNMATLTYAVMAMSMANDYSKSLGGRIIKSVDIKLAKAQQGQKLQLGSWMPRWIDFIGEDRQAGTFKLNAHADTIRRIATEYAAGKSMYQIAIELTSENVPTLQGGKWCQGTIANLVAHQCLTGDITIKGITLANYYPAVITRPQLEKLQAKLRENRNRKGAGEYVANLFRNCCKCAHCGGSMTTAKSHSHRLYTCVAKRVKQCKSKYSVRVADIEMDFFMLFLQQGPDTLLAKNTTEHADKVAAITSQIVGYDKSIADAMELIGVVDLSELKTKLADLNTKRETAKGIIERFNVNMLSQQAAPKALQDIRAILNQFTSPQSKASFVKWYQKGKSIYGPSLNAISFALHTDPYTIRFNQSVKDLQTALKDNEIRKKLLGLLPSIVKGLIIDTTAGRYRVVSINGVESEWREIV